MKVSNSFLDLSNEVPFQLSESNIILSSFEKINNRLDNKNGSFHTGVIRRVTFILLECRVQNLIERATALKKKNKISSKIYNYILNEGNKLLQRLELP